jgi:hypothetical protein
MRGVVNRRSDGVQEAGVGIGREVHRDIRLRRDGPYHLDVEHDFAVRPVRIARRAVGAAVDRHGHHRRCGQAKTLEIRVQIRRDKSAAQFNQGHTLALPGAGRKAIGGSHLRRRVGHGRARRPPQPKVRRGLWTVVEAEDRFDDTRQIGGQLYRPRAAAVASAGMSHAMQLNTEGGAELRHGSRQHHGAASGVLLLHRHAAGGGEGAHRGQVRRFGAVPLGKFIAAQERAGRAAGHDRGHSGGKILTRATAHEQGHVQSFRRLGRSYRAGARHRGAFAALERNVGHDLLPMMPDVPDHSRDRGEVRGFPADPCALRRDLSADLLAAAGARTSRRRGW